MVSSTFLILRTNFPNQSSAVISSSGVVKVGVQQYHSLVYLKYQPTHSRGVFPILLLSGSAGSGTWKT